MAKSILNDWFGDEWFCLLENYLLGEEFKAIGNTIAKARRTSSVLPPKDDRSLIFKAFKDVQPNQVKVVILGQDPYPQKGVYDGYAFSNSNSLKPSPSLRNILKSIERQFPENKERIDHGKLDDLDLSRWARQGVLLANTALTLIEKQPGSHAKLWDPFTRHWIKALSEYKQDIVWVLWGNHALEYSNLIKTGHTVTEGHPSPLNRSKPFEGKSLKVVNYYLKNTYRKEITW